MVLQAFREGADGVLVGGCHPGDCHHVDGNLRAAARLDAAGPRARPGLRIPRERLRVEWVGAAEGARFAEVVTRMTAELAALGPLDYQRRALDSIEDALHATPARLHQLEEARPRRRAPPASRGSPSTGTPPAAAARRR